MAYKLVPAAEISNLQSDKTGDQYRSVITTLADGGAMVVFEQEVIPDPSDFNSRDVAVLAQRYDAQGNKVGGLITLESEEGVRSDAYYPFVAGLTDGGYVIGWNDRTTDQLRVQVFDADGQFVSDTLLPVPPRDLGSQREVTPYAADGGAITALSDGGFSVTWNVTYSGILAQYAGATSVYTQTFDADGTARGGPVQIMPWVASVSFSQDRHNSVYEAVPVGDGMYLVVMRGGEGAPGNESEHTAILGRILDANGATVVDNFMISQDVETWADFASVAAFGDGSFVVAWRSETVSAWRKFAFDGSDIVYLGDQNDLTRQYRDVDVTATPDGGFLIGAQFVPTGSVAYSTHAYRFDADGEIVDERFVVTERRVPDPDANFYGKAPEFVILGNGQILTLIESNAFSDVGWEVMTWKQLAEILGSDASDSLQSTEDGTALFGLGGNDVLQGAAGGDHLDGATGNDTLLGRVGNDTLIAGAGNDSLDGGVGDDVLVSGQGENTVSGGGGTDHLLIDGIRVSGVTVRGPDNALVIAHDGNRTLVSGVETFEFREGFWADTLTLAELLPLRGHTVNGTDESETLRGDYGDDSIRALGGDDIAYGGEGDDTIDGYTGNDTLYGEAGDDSIVGSDGDDLIEGGVGDDTLRGLYGNDTLNGGTGFDRAMLDISSLNSFAVTGPDDRLTITSFRGIDTFVDVEEFQFNDSMMTLAELLPLRNVTLTGGMGDDTLSGDYGDDSILGGDGNDHLDGGPGNDTILGDNGRDRAELGNGDDLFIDNTEGGDLGRDTVFAGNGDDTIEGGAGADEFHGMSGDDVIFGRLGNDVIYGGIGFDTIDAGDGNDTVFGGDGRDRVAMGNGGDVFNDTPQGGELGRDTVFAGNGNDTIEGGNGADEFHGMSGDDVIFGRLGNDVIYGGIGFDTIDAGDGNDTVFGGDGRDRVFLGKGDDVFNDTPQGGERGRDTVFAGAGNDTIEGGNGDDIFRGELGDDVIFARLGNDTVIGGAGNDTMGGGGGADTFVFGPGFGADRINGYEKGTDTLEFDDALWSGTLSAAQVVSRFATDTGPDIRFDFGGGNTLLLAGVGDLSGLSDDLVIT